MGRLGQTDTERTHPSCHAPPFHSSPPQPHGRLLSFGPVFLAFILPSQGKCTVSSRLRIARSFSNSVSSCIQLPGRSLSWPANQFAASRFAAPSLCHCSSFVIPRQPNPARRSLASLLLRPALPPLPSTNLVQSPALFIHLVRSSFFISSISRPPHHPTPAVSKPSAWSPLHLSSAAPLLAGPILCTTSGQTDDHNDAIWCRPCGRMANCLSSGLSARPNYTTTYFALKQAPLLFLLRHPSLHIIRGLVPSETL
ncbi:hypothetical protein LY78DRAFT_214440 [Colletotrichum sublineola]|nr:hypothetical protein LY78DRAFT_214440 [Colletotrichum sublineola]